MFKLSRMATGVAALASVAVLLVGCSSETTSETDNAASGEGETRVVDTKFGEVEVPADAERIVALGWGDAETALALGVQPVGASDWLAFGGEGVGPWAEGMYDEAPEIIGTMEPEFEKIAALEPDLILDVKSSGDEERYERLTQIAPTVGIPEGGESYLTSLDEQVELIAEALGKEQEGELLLAGVEAKFDEASEANPEFEGKSVTVSAFTSEGWGAYVSESERVQFMENIGFEANPAIDELEADGFSVSISEENIGVLDADLLVTFPIYLPASDVSDQELFQNIPAVQDGRYILFNDDQADIREAFSLNSVLSIPFAIDELTPMIAEAVK